MGFKTEVEMQSEFIEFLKKQGYPSDTIETERHISSKTAKFSSRLDVAIVVGGKMIQAFELKKDAKTKDIKHTLHQVGMYEEFMDSARGSAEIHIVTYDDGDWWVYSKQKQCWLNASVLSFDRVANELYIKAYEQIANKTIFTKLNFNSIKWTCWIFSGTTLLYLIAHITLHALRHCRILVTDLPLTPEIATSLIAVVIGVLLPLLLPYIESVKIEGAEFKMFINGMNREFSKRQSDLTSISIKEDVI